MERLKVSQVAKILGITPTAVYRKFKTSSELIQNHVHKEKGVTYLDADGLEILKASMQKVHAVSEDTCKNEPVQNLVETLQKELDRKQGIIESLIAQNETQRQRTDTILMKLTNDISTLQKCLEYKNPEATPTTSAAVTSLNPRKEDIPAPIRAVVLESSQREITFFESVKLGIDDCFGLLFGRG